MDPVVILAAESVSAGPGQEARLPVRVRNQGRRVESYRIDVVGPAAAFAEVTPTTVSVLPGREAEIDVVFRPPGGAATPTGVLPFAVRATSEVDASSSAATEGTLELSGAAGLQVWVPETTRSGRWSAGYDIEFANSGNAAVRLAVIAHDAAGALALRLSDDVVDLPPGGRARAHLTAKVRQPFLRGTPVNRVVQLSCQNFPFGSERPVPGAAPPVDDPHHRTFQLAFQQKPILPKAAIPIALLVLALLVAFVLLRYRGGEEYALELARPPAPPGLAAEAAGPNAVFVSWDTVPNATGYVLRGGTTAGVPIDDVPLTPDLDSYQLGGLQPSTEYCLQLYATGPEEGDLSEASGQACATTTAEAQLEAPTDVTVTPVGGDEYEVAWQSPYLGDPEIEFRVLLDNTPTGTPATASPTRIVIPPGDITEPRSVSVQAVRGEERSGPSEPHEIVIAAAPPGTAVATTAPGGGPPTTAGGPVATDGGTPATTAPGGASTTTSPVTTTSVGATTTVPSPAGSELQNLAPTWVAMLGQWNVPAEGGLSLEQRKAGLARTYGIPVGEMEEFSNRDTVATENDGAATPFGQTASPSDLFVYVRRDDPEQAAELCEIEPTMCRVLLLRGAADLAEGGPPVLVVEERESGVTLGEIDEALVARRTALARPSVYVLNGEEYAQFGPDQIIIFASGFQNEAEIDQFCATAGLPACRTEILTAR